MTAPPYMPLYIGDYERDTKHLTTIEHGAYLLLLMHAWCHKGTIPSDSASLRAITKLDNKTWQRRKNKLLALFVRQGRTLGHARVSAELANALKRQQAEKNKSERPRGIHKEVETFLYGESARSTKHANYNGSTVQAAAKRLASEASQAQAELPIATPKQKQKIPVSDELKYLVSRSPRGARKGGRA